MQLPDASTIALNTATRLRVTFSHGRRAIELLQGEALFGVAHDPSRPFEVRTAGGIARAVGTRFDVALHNAGTEVSVLEGTVVVAAADDRSEAAAVRVGMGQAVDYAPSGAISAVRPADRGRIDGWQSQRIVFSHMSLAAAIEEYNRYTTTPIVLANEALADRRISGVFRIGDEEAFVHALEREFPLLANRSDDRIVMETRAPAH